MWAAPVNIRMDEDTVETNEVTDQPAEENCIIFTVSARIEAGLLWKVPFFEPPVVMVSPVCAGRSDIAQYHVYGILFAKAVQAILQDRI